VLVEKRVRVVEKANSYNSTWRWWAVGIRLARSKTTPLPTRVFVARGCPCDGTTLGIVQTRLAKLARANACAEFVLAHATFGRVGFIEGRTIILVTAILRRNALAGAAFLRLPGQRDAMIRNAGAILVGAARVAVFAHEARLAQNAKRSLEHRVSLTERRGVDARRIERHFPTESVVPFARDAANLVRVSRNAAVKPTRTIRIGFAVIFGAVSVGITIAVRQTPQLRRALLRAARKYRARRTIRTLADVAVCPGVTRVFIDCTSTGNSAALGGIALFTCI
jgi:hypothetical protein